MSGVTKGIVAAPNADTRVRSAARVANRTPRGQAISADDTSDETLIARVAEGDRRALQRLFIRHQQRVYRFVLRLVSNGATAEDIVSDVFIDLCRHAANFDRRAQFSTWMLAIARNKALTARRRRIDQPLEDAEDVADPAITAEEASDAGKRSTALRTCLGRLSPAHRQIVDLVYYHEKSIEEVSAIIGVPAATVKTRMFHARKRLAELLRASGIDTMRC
jgi:RNA polymerase sigma-70 factor (ECF subfamily)